MIFMLLVACSTENGIIEGTTNDTVIVCGEAIIINDVPDMTEEELLGKFSEMMRLRRTCPEFNNKKIEFQPGCWGPIKLNEDLFFTREWICD